MKRRIAVVAAALLLADVAGVGFAAGRKELAPKTEVVVFAAASMTEALNEIAALYAKTAPGVSVIYNFDSSGTLKTQIQAGAPCDIFISAGLLQMNQLDITSDKAVNKDGLDFVLQGSRFNIVSNEVVLIVPKGAAKGINDFRDLLTDKVSLAALGNSDVPVGQYSEQIYTNLGLWADLQKSGKVTYGSNVKEVLAHVASGAVDCGIVYGTDAASESNVSVAAFAPAGSHPPVTYPAAIIKGCANQAAAEAFMQYLKGTEASRVFEKIGFAKPPA
jgi:molybdate transport system substrate-binding protein